MRTTLVMVLLTLSAARVAVAGMPASRPWSRTRPLTPSAATLLMEAAERAPAVLAQLEALERTDVVVYVMDSLCPLESEPRAYLRFVARAAGLRYVAVHIDRWQSSRADRISWLSHELHHALEIAAAPNVQDEAGLTRFYRRIGWQSGKSQFETDAAKAAGRLVRNQLIGLQR